MKGKEPTSRLVYPFGDEIGREQTVKPARACLERIVVLCVGHGAGIEPYVYQVALASHRLAFGAYQHYVVDIRAVQIYAIVVLFRKIALAER